VAGAIAPWLPALITLATFGGDRQRFQAAIRAQFDADLDGGRIKCIGKTVVLGADTFDHVTTTDSPYRGMPRDPADERCERIAWIGALLRSAGTPGETRLWRAKHNRRKRLYVGLDDFSYFITLGESNRTLILITAYPVWGARQRAQLLTEWLADPNHLPP
jgi:hypothetical protein